MNAPFNRHTGLMILDVTLSNPNGDPDLDSEPRILEADGRGLISPVSIKRKLRDMVESHGPAWDLADETLSLSSSKNRFGILESRGRDLKEIAKMNRDSFIREYWDARIFGNTMLESMKNAKGIDDKKAETSDHFINTGVVQIGVGTSIAPVKVERMTFTNKSGVQEGKDRGMAPMAFKVVQHGIYIVPFFVNPGVAAKTGTSPDDLELLKFLLPHTYSQTTSAIRPQISVLHCWLGEHKSPLGSCPDHLLLKALAPTIKDNVVEPSSSHDYVFPVPEKTLEDRFANLEDLVGESW